MLNSAGLLLGAGHPNSSIAASREVKWALWEGKHSSRGKMDKAPEAK